METNISERPAESANQPTASRWRHPGVIVTGGCILALAVIGIAWAVNDDDSGQPPPLTDSSGTGGDVAPASIDPVTSDDILRVISQAQDSAQGVPVSVESSGASWLVELEKADGTETTVRVEGDSVSVVESERDNEAGQTNGLDRANVEAAMQAALAQAAGTVVAISADDDSIRDAYSVDILTADKSEVTEVELDSDFKVTNTETERNDN